MSLDQYRQRPYNQNDYVDDTNRAAVGIGACLGLSLGWIDLHKKMKNTKWNGHQKFSPQSDKLTGKSDDWNKALVAIHVAATNARGKDPKVAAQSYGLNYTTRPEYDMEKKTGLPGYTTDLPTRFSLSCNSYAILLLAGNRGSHAIAIYRSGGWLGLGKVGFASSNYYIFDPNLGEFKAGDNEMPVFLTKLCGHHSQLDRFTINDVA